MLICNQFRNLRLEIPTIFYMCNSVVYLAVVLNSVALQKIGKNFVGFSQKIFGNGLLALL